MKTSELTGAALDWAVMTAEGPNSFAACFYYDGNTPLFRDDQGELPYSWMPSVFWDQSGEIIEREGISIQFRPPGSMHEWVAFCGDSFKGGTTPTVAAMRAYVAEKLGDAIAIPDELMEAA